MKKTISFLVFYSTFFITNVANASGSRPGEGYSFIPLLIVFAILYFAVVKPINKRKGGSKLSELLILVPLVNIIYMYRLVSLTDKAVLEKIDSLEKKIQKLDPNIENLNCDNCNSKQSNNYVCDNCKTPYRLEDYDENAEKIYCSNCKAELTPNSH